jgi:dihydrolipoamide dehydrogenase
MATTGDKYDVVIIGGGPGGYVAAARAAQLGLKTALVEKDRLGGVCLNWGCIPTKSMLESARVLDLMKRAADFGLQCRDATPDWQAIVKRSRAAADRMSKGVEALMKKNKVEVIAGTASFEAPLKLKITAASGGRTLESRNVIIATGAQPNALPGFPFDGKHIISSYEAMVLPEIPRRLLIIGAGAIGAEFAWLYSVMGSEVTLVEMLDNVLPQGDEEVSRLVERSFQKRGIKVHTGAKVTDVNKSREVWRYKIADAKKAVDVDAELCLVAVGVHANLDGLNLDKINVELDHGFVKVNNYMRTSLPGVWAIGDCNGDPLLAHAASHEGICAVESIAGVPNPGVNRDNTPGCVYCHPTVASVGITEREAKEAGRKIKVGKAFFLANGYAQAAGETDGFVKFIVGKEYNDVLGVHIVGPGAPELIAEVVLGRVLEVTAREFATTIHSHPTLSETVMEAAAAAVGEAIHS